MRPQSFSVTQGETLEEIVATRDDFEEPVDLTNSTLSLAIAREPGDDIVAGTDISPPNATASSTVDGEVFLTIPAETTALMLGTYAWNCLAIGSETVLVARGYLTVNKAIAA